MCKVISNFTEFDISENLLIFSEPRGGSTWLSEVLNSITNTVVLWEPLNPRAFKCLRKLNFGWRQFIPDDADWPEAMTFFDKMMRGKFLNNHTCSRAPVLDFLKAERMIIKFCRGNALLPWLTKRFNFKYAPIYLVRHPFAVVASQLRHGAWDNKPGNFPIPECPYNDIYVRHSDFLTRIETLEEKLLASWCITNLVPLKNKRNNKDWVTVYYEHFITDPEQEVNRIFQRWQLDLPENIYDRVRKPSATIREATFQRSIEEQLVKWKQSFSKEQLKNMMAVLEYFELEHYSMEAYPISHTATVPTKELILT